MITPDRVAEVMSPNPVSLDADRSLWDAARQMRDSDIGDVVVLKDGNICGIATDRDIVVRAVADGKDPRATTIGEVCSKEVTTLLLDTSIDDAVALMRDKALRRLPVVQDGMPVGIVSLGDLAMKQDPRSALADISGAPANT